jgi:hypothetical protein
MKATLLKGKSVPKHSDLLKITKPFSTQPVWCSLGEIYTDGKFYYVYTAYDCVQFSNLSKVEQAIKIATTPKYLKTY